MHISNIVIKNFRAIEDIHCELGKRINVIVGPNTIGKTTILQAIRLAKALLSPRSPNEAMQTLISLGVASPHFPQRAFLQSLARDITRAIEVRFSYCLIEEELKSIIESKTQLIQNIVQSRLGQSFANPAALIQFLASPQGRSATLEVETEVNGFINKIETDKKLLIGLIIDPASGKITPIDQLAGSFLGYLDQKLPPYITVFSYFPADRALPFGETAVQLGAADTQQQIEAHNSQPQLKYSRLKNLIFNSIVMGEKEKQSLINEFEKIFTGILRGRRIDSLGINQLGLLSVMIEELDTHRKIEIDNLSSGEKNLTLTFLLIAKTISEGGIVLNAYVLSSENVMVVELRQA